MENNFNGEKVSVNINTATLSAIDLLVDNGYYSNRSDFINQSLRESVQRHQSQIDQIRERYLYVENKKIWFMGVYAMTPEDLERLQESGKQYPIRGYGLLNIDSKCSEDALFSVISEIKVKGRVVCSPSIKAHYGLK